MKFVCWLWRGSGFWKRVARYDEKHVSTLASMLSRHGDHELICVQDGTFDIPGSIIMPPHVRQMPDYLPKLWAWSPEFHAIIGERFASIDLDVVIFGDLGQILDWPFCIWDYARRERYNTSLFTLTPGMHQDVWTSLTPDRLQAAKASADYWTGDQSWVGHVLGAGRRTFGVRDGVVNYSPKVQHAPPGALACFMCGPYEPAAEAARVQWVREAWR